jgi:hypothetical protein
MRDQVNNLLDLIGLSPNEVQVVEDTNYSALLFYPNMVETGKVSGDYTDSELLDVVENLVEKHLTSVKMQLSMIRKFKKTWFGDDKQGQRAKV